MSFADKLPGEPGWLAWVLSSQACYFLSSPKSMHEGSILQDSCFVYCPCFWAISWENLNPWGDFFSCLFLRTLASWYFKSRFCFQLPLPLTPWILLPPVSPHFLFSPWAVFCAWRIKFWLFLSLSHLFTPVSFPLLVPTANRTISLH